MTNRPNLKYVTCNFDLNDLGWQIMKARCPICRRINIIVTESGLIEKKCDHYYGQSGSHTKLVFRI